jgi:hypothetical protein
LDLVVHTTHAARRHGGAGSGLLRQLGDDGLGGDQERRNRSCVLDRHTHDLGWVDDALGDQVAVVAALRVEAVAVPILPGPCRRSRRPFATRTSARTPPRKAARRIVLRCASWRACLSTKWRNRSWRISAFHEPSPRRSKNGARADPTPSPRGRDRLTVPRPNKPYAML